jgi:hypothetical protein
MKNTLLVLALAACAPNDLPESLQVDAAFSDEQTAAIDDAVEHWCLATGWCPERTVWGSDIRLEANYAKYKRPEGSQSFNDGTKIIVNGSGTWPDLSDFWLTIAHELGHFGTGHTDVGVMAAVHPGFGVRPACLDAAAVDAFCDDSMQCKWKRPTCTY